jgi:drug/metabolite transporter (DMT)-like permease
MELRLELRTKVHLALLLANSFWGIGAVVGGIGLSSAHPLAFLTIRQTLAGVLLFGCTNICSSFDNDQDASAKNSRKSLNLLLKTKYAKDSFSHYCSKYWKPFALLGFTLFGSNVGFLVGIILAGPVTGSVWQPSQPIIMAYICVMMGWEPWNSMRMTGVALAFLGCICMVLLAPQEEESFQLDESKPKSSTSSTTYWTGNLLLFINCLCDPSFVVISKRLLNSFSPLSITTYSYFISASYMGVSTLVSLLLIPIFESKTSPSSVWISGSIIPPLSAMPALLYFVLFSSSGAYALITWANQHATGTLVMSYTVLQPVSAVFLTLLLLEMKVVPACGSNRKPDDAIICLNPPNWGTFLGMIGVGLGLSMIIVTEPKRSKKISLKATPSVDVAREHLLPRMNANEKLVHV